MFNRHGAQMSEVTQAVAGAADKSRSRKTQPLAAAMDDEALLKMETIEALTGLSRSTIYSLIAKKKFPDLIRLSARCSRGRAGTIRAWLREQGR